MSDSRSRWRIRFYGRVQHVGFRYTAMYLAQSLQLTGWVRNLPDGSVLMEVQGETSQLRKLLIRLKCQPHIHIGKTEIFPFPLLLDETGFTVPGGTEEG